MPALRLVLSACLGALVLTATAAGAGASQTFLDSPGDSGAAADITAVVVSNDPNGQITFSLTLVNRTDVLVDDTIVIPLDSDLDSRTGEDGFDHLIEFNGADRTVDLGHWTGTRWDYDVPQATLSSADGKTFSVNRSDLGRTRGFYFGVISRLASDGNVFDGAPGGTEPLWRYALDGFPLANIGYATFTTPRAGSTFSLARLELGLTDGKRVKPTTFTCTAKIGTKTLKPVRRCAWKLAKSTKGKRIAVVIAVTYDGQSGQIQPYSFRVR